LASLATPVVYFILARFYYPVVYFILARCEISGGLFILARCCVPLFSVRLDALVQSGLHSLTLARYFG
jgi:hypothetical protein